MNANKIICVVIVIAIIFLLIQNVNIVEYVKSHVDNVVVENDDRPYFDIDVLPLDKKKHHKEKQKFIHGVPTPKEHTLPGVPTPTKQVNLTPHELN